MTSSLSTATAAGLIRRAWPRSLLIGVIRRGVLPNTLPNSYDASGICTHALRLVMPAIGAGPGVLAQRSGALAVWATGEPILVYRRAANEPSPALAAAQRQSKVRVPADGPLREPRKGRWPTSRPLSLRLPTNSGSPVAQTTPVLHLHGLRQQSPGVGPMGETGGGGFPRPPRHDLSCLAVPPTGMRTGCAVATLGTTTVSIPFSMLAWILSG